MHNISWSTIDVQAEVAKRADRAGQAARGCYKKDVKRFYTNLYLHIKPTVHIKASSTDIIL